MDKDHYFGVYDSESLTRDEDVFKCVNCTGIDRVEALRTKGFILTTS